MHPLTLDLMPHRLAVARLEPEAALPDWAQRCSGFVSVTRTRGELSIVCPDADVPAGITAQRGYRCLGVRGTLDFALTGILAGLTRPLAEAGISVFAVSSYDTDFLLIREADLGAAMDVLRGSGFAVDA